jgi:hypothetical protein
MTQPGSRSTHPRAKTPADYRALAKSRHLKWLGPMVSRIDIKTTWQCARGHQWQSKYSTIRQRGGCPVCAGKIPKTPADYHALARQRGLSWCGPVVSKVSARTTWQCARGHDWQQTYNVIQQGSGCPICACRVPKTPTDYRTLAQARGLQWLGPEVSNTQTKTGWQCPHGHRWQATYNSLQQGRGCPVCSGKARKMSDDYRALARVNGLKWLGPEVANVAAKTTWQCAQGHRWQATYNTIQQGCGCPVCAGNQPRTSADYRALAKAHGLKWPGAEAPATREKTFWQCSHGHRFQAKYNTVQQGHGCPVCAGNKRKTPDDYRQLAADRGYRWLGPEVRTTHLKTRWRCSLGHEWQARYGTLQQGHGCPICAGGSRSVD